MSERKMYYVSADVENCQGSQTWRVEATSKEEALEIKRAGGGCFYIEEVEVYHLGEFYIAGEEEIPEEEKENGKRRTSGKEHTDKRNEIVEGEEEEATSDSEKWGK